MWLLTINCLKTEMIVHYKRNLQIYKTKSTVIIEQTIDSGQYLSCIDNKNWMQRMLSKTPLEQKHVTPNGSFLIRIHRNSMNFFQMLIDGYLIKYLKAFLLSHQFRNIMIFGIRILWTVEIQGYETERIENVFLDCLDRITDWAAFVFYIIQERSYSWGWRWAYIPHSNYSERNSTIETVLIVIQGKQTCFRKYL